jgi:endonuclease/exonuclease/phosphatase family metal-dependent hydrolase
LIAPAFRVLSYNLHKGRSLGNLRYLLTEMKEGLKSCQADVVFLQEVRGDQFEFLADEVWSYFSYGKNSIYQSGDHGNAILSKWPIREITNLDLSLNRVERRGLLHGVIEVENLPLHLFCTHLNLLEVSRQKQLTDISTYILRELGSERHFILAGDFNDWQRLAPMRLAQELGVLNVFNQTSNPYPVTYPSVFPLLSLDRLFVRGFHVANAQVLQGTPWNTLSDHLPIVADLKYLFIPHPI